MLNNGMTYEAADKLRKALREFMDWYEISENEWCRRAGWQRNSTLNNFMKGHSNDMNYSTLERLAKSLGVTVGMITGEVRLPRSGLEDRSGQGYETMPPSLALSPEDRKLLELFHGFDESDKDRLIRMAEFIIRDRSHK